MWRLLTASFLAGLLAAGCGSPREVAFDETRTFEHPARALQPEMAEAERLGLRLASPAAVPEPAPSPAGAQAELIWDVPEGWREARGEGGMRLAAFVPEEGSGWECVLYSLPGDAGGVRANLDRWREQMGLSPLTHAEFTGLPRIGLLGRQAPVLFAEGDYRGMGASEARVGSALLGVAASLGESSVFVKLTGEAGAVEAQRGAFESLCKSLRRGTQ